MGLLAHPPVSFSSTSFSPSEPVVPRVVSPTPLISSNTLPTSFTASSSSSSVPSTRAAPTSHGPTPAVLSQSNAWPCLPPPPSASRRPSLNFASLLSTFARVGLSNRKTPAPPPDFTSFEPPPSPPPPAHPSSATHEQSEATPAPPPAARQTSAATEEFPALAGGRPKPAPTTRRGDTVLSCGSLPHATAEPIPEMRVLSKHDEEGEFPGLTRKKKCGRPKEEGPRKQSNKVVLFSVGHVGQS